MEERMLTGFSPQELQELFILSNWILHDCRHPNKKPLELLYCYGETEDNWDSVLKKAVALANSGLTKVVGICSAMSANGYPGFEYGRDELRRLGLKKKIAIEPIDVIAEDDVNTLSEARGVAGFISDKSFADVGIIAAPFHMVRAFMTTVTAMQDGSNWVYGYTGAVLPWNEYSTYSQGALVEIHRRVGLLSYELERIEKYRAAEFGGLFSPREVLRYLVDRDATNPIFI